MRLLVQRVLKASVQVEGKEVSSIEKGLLVFLGVHQKDESPQVKWLVSKLAHLRIFKDDQSKMNLSVLDVKGEILVVSQFTLYGDCLHGRRPDFFSAADPLKADALYKEFLKLLSEQSIPVSSGVFGANMQVSLVNDGPVTLWLETP